MKGSLVMKIPCYVAEKNNIDLAVRENIDWQSTILVSDSICIIHL